MRALTTFRVALAISLLVYLTALAGSLAGLVSGELVLMLGTCSALAVAVTAFGCVATQLMYAISKKRRTSHG